MMLPISTFLFLSVVYSLINLIKRLDPPLSQIPGPWYSRLTNWPLKYHTISGRRIYHIDGLHKRYGPIVQIAPGEVSVATAAAYKKIYSVASKFTKHRWYQAFSGHSRPVMFSMSDMREHAARRKVMARAFTKSQLRAAWEPEIRHFADTVVDKVLEDLQNGGRSDIMKWFRFMASDVSGKLMFGDNFECLERGTSHEVIDIIETFFMGTALSAELPFIPVIARLIPHPYMRKMFDGWDSVLEFAGAAVSRTRQQAYGSSKTIFGDVVERAEKNEELLDEDIRYEAGDFTVAGTETTATTLTYIIWAILSRPNIQQRVVEEVLALPSNYTDQDVDALPFLSAVVKECGRLHGAVQGWLPRVFPAGGALIEGHWVPEGTTTIGAQGFTLYRDPTLFPNPEKFDPSRWFPENNISSDSLSVYHPFGPGSRVCLGKHLAEMQIRLATAAFFRRCEGARLTPETTPEAMGFLNFFVTIPKYGKCEISL